MLGDFDPAKGWDGSKHLRILGDLTGDHCADIIGFGDAGAYSATSHGDGTFAAPSFILAAMGYDDGWRIDRHPRFAADVTGDGTADLVGFGDDGVWTSVTGGSGANLVLDGLCYNQGWRVPLHPRALADLNGDGRADIVGFGDAGVWIALSNGDGTFQPAAFVLADFGYHAGPVVSSITIDFHTLDDDLNDDSVVHVFVKNRRADSMDSAGAGTYVANLQAYQAADANWFDKNPYLGCAIDASHGQGFGNDSTHTVTIELRSKPIPLEELLLLAVNVHILAKDEDRWRFNYTLNVTLDDGTVLPPFSSDVDGVTGIILDQDNRNYYGICTEVNPTPRVPPVTDALLTGVTIEFNTHNDDKNSDTKLGIHISNRVSATESHDISVANDLAPGVTFHDSGDTYNRLDLPLASNEIYLRDMVLPIVTINIAAGTDQWIFDYRVTFFFGQDQPYSWTISGVVLDQDRHKHVGAYNGRPFPSLYYPYPPLASAPAPRNKTISLDFVGQKLEELLNGRQVAGSPDPIIKLKLDSARQFGDAIPPSLMDLQFIVNDAPSPDAPLLGPTQQMGTTYAHNVSELGQFTTWFGLGVRLNDINSASLSLTLNSGDDQTPFTAELAFETGGPTEITGSYSLNVNELDVRIRCTLRFHQATGAVDLMGWVDDINGFTYTQVATNPPLFDYAGTFLGQAMSGSTNDPDRFRTDLIGQVLHVNFSASSVFDGPIQKRIREGIFNHLSSADSITKVTLRDSINAMVSSWLMGSVIASGNTELQPYPSPCTLVGVSVADDVLSLDYITPEKTFVYEAPDDWPAELPPGRLANIEHIVVLMQENRSFDHMLGYLSLPVDQGGMGRSDVDGLSGDNANLYDGRKVPSFRFPAGDTIFAPGPPNSAQRVVTQVDGGSMGGFVQAQADECGPETAHRVMGYHGADNVPTYDSLARDFAIGNRWFCSHPGSTFPNRFYTLTGRPNIDPWGAWEYTNSSPMHPVFTDTIFEHLSRREVSWTYFEHAYSFLRFFERHTFDSQNLVDYDDPKNGFLERARSGNLPSVSFVDPHFVDYPPGAFCDEPPSDIRNSQPFIRELVEAVVAGPKWEQTLLLITYDEHGGFYDHVAPPPAVKVSPEMLPTTGVRVPCFVVSPWVKGASVFGSDKVHFDHTSIAKTIVRRFLSEDPPYMGPRYAAAHDLSEVLDEELRPEQFRPFIPYTLTYAASRMNLDVEGAGTSAGTPLWQYSPNGTDAQSFRFEDAGDGFVYLRTLAGLYVTAEPPSRHTTEPPAPRGVMQDVKYVPHAGGSRHPNLQRWKLSPGAVSVLEANEFTIECEAVPGKVLQPLDGGTASGVVVVLADPTEHAPSVPANPWVVTSPLLPTTVTEHP